VSIASFLLLIAGLALTSFLPRASFIILFAHWPVPEVLRRGLRFVPAAVFSAILAPELLLTAGAIDISLHNPRLLAGILAAAVAWRTRNTLLTIAVGMPALHLFAHLAN
jgi:branched-subunit amino acid transport protein